MEWIVRAISGVGFNKNPISIFFAAPSQMKRGLSQKNETKLERITVHTYKREHRGE